MSFAQLESEITTLDTPNITLQNSTSLELESEMSQAQEEQILELESLNPLAFFSDNHSFDLTQNIIEIDSQIYSNHLTSEEDSLIILDKLITDSHFTLDYKLYFESESITLGLYKADDYSLIESKQISNKAATLTFENPNTESYIGLHLNSQSPISIQTLEITPVFIQDSIDTQITEDTPETVENHTEDTQEVVAQELNEQTTDQAPELELEDQATESEPEVQTPEAELQEQTETPESEPALESTINEETETFTQDISETTETQTEDTQQVVTQDMNEETEEQAPELEQEQQATESEPEVQITDEPQAQEQSETIEPESVEEAINDNTPNEDSLTTSTNSTDSNTILDQQQTTEATENPEPQETTETQEQPTEDTTQPENTNSISESQEQPENTHHTSSDSTDTANDSIATESSSTTQSSSSNTSSSQGSSSSSQATNTSQTINTANSQFVSNVSDFQQSSNSNQTSSALSQSSSVQTSQNQPTRSVSTSNQSQQITQAPTERQKQAVDTSLDSQEKVQKNQSAVRTQVLPSQKQNDELFTNTAINFANQVVSKKSIESSAPGYQNYIIEESQFNVPKSDVKTLASQSNITPLLNSQIESENKPQKLAFKPVDDEPLQKTTLKVEQSSSSQIKVDTIINSQSKLEANQVASNKKFEFASLQASLIVKKPFDNADKQLTVDTDKDLEGIELESQKLDIQQPNNSCNKRVCSPLNKYLDENKKLLREKKLTLDLNPEGVNTLNNPNFLISGNSKFKNARVELYLKRQNSIEQIASKLTDSKGDFYFVINSNLVNNQNYTLFAEIKSQQSPSYKVKTDFKEPEMQYAPEKFCGKKLANSQLKCRVSKLPTLEFNLPENKYLEVLFNSEVTPGRLESQSLKTLVVQPEKSYLETLSHSKNHKVVYIVRDKFDPTKISSPVVVEFKTYLPIFNPVTTPMILFFVLIVGALAIEKIFFNVNTNDQPQFESLTEDI